MDTAIASDATRAVPTGGAAAPAQEIRVTAEDEASLDRLIQTRMRAVWRELDQEEQARTAR